MFTGTRDATGAINSTFGDTTYTGLYMPDGSLRVHTDASTGLYSASGGIRVTIATSGTTNGVYAPDGSLYVVKSTTDTTPGLYGTYGSIRMTAVDSGATPTAIIQSKTTAVQTGSAIVPTWTTPPTTGNLIVYAINASYTITTPTSWTLSAGASTCNALGTYLFWKIATGTNDAAGWTPSGNFTAVYSQAEFSLINAVPFDVASGANAAAAGQTTITTSSIAPYSGKALVLALLGTTTATASQDASAVWSSFTNSYLEVTHGGFGASALTLGAGVDQLGQTLNYKLLTGDGVTTTSTAANVPSDLTASSNNQTKIIASFKSTGT